MTAHYANIILHIHREMKLHVDVSMIDSFSFFYAAIVLTYPCYTLTVLRNMGD
jgi:hypothetical protein